jgi:hypothetical protein
LAWAIRDLDKNHVLSQTDFNRRIAAQREVEAVTAAYETDTVTIDRVLEAQRALAVAESDFYRALVDYNKAIAMVHFRKGSLLEYNGVYLAEGPWPGKAYFDARRRARARDAGTYLNYGYTMPRVISRGPIEQNTGSASLFGDGDTVDTSPAGGQNQGPAPAVQPELLPTPDPNQTRPTTESPTEPQTPISESPKLGDGRTAGNGNAGRREGSGPALTARKPNEPAGTAGLQGLGQAAGWVVTPTGSTDESGANPTAAAVDRTAASWKGLQH